MWEEEFKIERLQLEHSNPEDFSICNWQKGVSVHAAWLTYRIFTFLQYTSTLVWVIVDWETGLEITAVRKNFLVYVSNWSHMIQAIVFTFGLIVTGIDYNKQREGSEPDGKLSVVKKIFWFLYTLSLSCTVLVCIGFWSAVYKRGSTIKAPTIILHVTNGVFHVIDFFLVAFPHRFFHFYMPLCLIFVYLIFSVIYELLEGTNDPIYPILDWKNQPLKTCAYFVAFLLALICIHFVFFLFSMMKRILRMNRINK